MTGMRLRIMPCGFNYILMTPNSKLSVCFSDYLNYQRDDNYIDINGQKFKYYDICKSFDKIQVMIEQESIREALEAL